ncbi:MAG: branched-chain amino acid transaminase [Candidatus Tectomicrobia bacterium]|nr:branched-chain amino acid transaminase [Candidatus Tectomicrobia bacterium]
MQEVKKIWMDGKLVDWADAKVHILTHTLHYGLGVFEGIRCYATKDGSAVFRHDEHIERLFGSAHIVGMKIPFTPQQIKAAIKETIRANELDACYIRPIVYFGYGVMGLNSTGAPVNVSIAVWPWGAYLGEEGMEHGIRVRTSSFTRHHINISMTKAKVCGNYANSQLAKLEAVRDGFDEALMLDPQGNVVEGTGENLFMVRRGVIKTPPITNILEGITRDSLMQIARDQGHTVIEQNFSRDELYTASEVFLTGTAAELTPIREVDGRTISGGTRGPVTTALQDTFFAVVHGEDSRYKHWLDYIQ